MACHGEKVMACVRGYHEALFLADPVTFSTSRLAYTITADHRLADRDPLGSGSPLMGFR